MWRIPIVDDDRKYRRCIQTVRGVDYRLDASAAKPMMGAS